MSAPETRKAPVSGGLADSRTKGSSGGSVHELTSVLNLGGFSEATCECGTEIAGMCDACGDAFCDRHLLWGGEAGPTLCHGCAYPSEGAL